MDVFLSYSRNDLDAAVTLRDQLKQCGLSVFHDIEGIRASELWLDKLQAAVDRCNAFVVLVGRDGVRRWIGAETQVALSRYFGPHDDSQRLPIFPILLAETQANTLPAFLRLFQATPWNGADPLPDELLDQIRARTIVADTTAAFEGCPFVGLAAYGIDQAHLFFGRQKETLDALARFNARRGAPTVRWLEINGNSGSGKSSLMQAGLLPLVDQGWLWPRTGYAHWRRIGPMMPGEHPVGMLAEVLARAWTVEMADVSARLKADGDAALAYWLRSRKEDDTAFLLAIDQFEELFTFADADERRRFDRLLAAALEDFECPLFVISTVRSDFLDSFEDLPRLVAVRTRAGWPWTLAPIGDDGLREVIEGPARLAGLDVSDVQAAMVAEARDEPGALPLVENALHYLWQKREGNLLSGRLFTDQGGLAGILSHSADALLDGLGKPQRDKALELLFRLVQVDPKGRRHTRRQMPLDEATAVAGGGEVGRRLLNHLAGGRARDGSHAEGPLRLITISEEGASGGKEPGGRWINLIHETLIKAPRDAAGKPQPYWPTLWSYIENNKERAARRERLQLLARDWKDRKSLSRLFGLAGWSELFGFRGLAAPGSLEQHYLRRSWVRALVQVVILTALTGLVSESIYWAAKHQLPYEAIPARWAYRLGWWDLPLPDLVEIPAGQLMRGNQQYTNEQPVRFVPFAEPFYLSATEITFAQYDAFLKAMGRLRDTPFDRNWGRDKQPVINVSWFDAWAYAQWLGAMTDTTCRLPSEAEWEYACRAGTTTEFALPAPNGSDDIRSQKLANCTDCGSRWDGQQPAPVESFAGNAWGLRDMHGNVWEWVNDCYYENFQEAPDEGQAWLKEDKKSCPRALRGGSWNNSLQLARCASRNSNDPNDRFINVGFRLFCSSSIY